MFRQPPKLSRDLTSPVFRVNPLAISATAAASLPPNITPIPIANLQFSLVSAFDNQSFTVDLGSRAARVPLPYAICLTLKDPDGPLRPISIRLERILDPRPTLFVGVISGNVDLSTASAQEGGPTSLQGVLENNALTFWAAPDSFEPNGSARLLLTVTDDDYNDHEVPIDIKALPVSPSISVEAPGYPHRQLRTETNLSFKEHDKGSDVLITVWNETENHSPVLVNAVVEESCGGAFSIGESYRASKSCVPLLINGGNSCTFYARFEMTPELTARKCYYGSVLIKYAAALPAEGAPGQDQELHQFYDHVLNFRADGTGNHCQHQGSPDWDNPDTSRRILVDDECVCSDTEEHGDRACILFEDHESPGQNAFITRNMLFDPAAHVHDPLGAPQGSVTPGSAESRNSHSSRADRSKLTAMIETKAPFNLTDELLVGSELNAFTPILATIDKSVSGSTENDDCDRQEGIDQKSTQATKGSVYNEQSLPLVENSDLVSSSHPEGSGFDEALFCDVSMLAEVSTVIRRCTEPNKDENRCEPHFEFQACDHQERDAKNLSHKNIQRESIPLPPSSKTQLSADPVLSGIRRAETSDLERRDTDCSGAHDVADSPGGSANGSAHGESSHYNSVTLPPEGLAKPIDLENQGSFSKQPKNGSNSELRNAALQQPSDDKHDFAAKDHLWNSEWKIGGNLGYHDASQFKQSSSEDVIPAQSTQDLTGVALISNEFEGSRERRDLTAETQYDTGSRLLETIKRPKLKMPRRIRENGIVVEANSGSVEFPVLNASSEVVEVSIFVERVKGNGGDECFVNVTPNYVVLAAQGKAILTMTRTSAQGGEHHILLRGSTLGPQPKKRSYRIPAHVVRSAMRLESNEEFAVDRPTMSFFNPDNEGREWSIRIRNGTQHVASYNTWVGPGCGELLNSMGEPAFRIVGSASGSIDPQKFARVQVEFIGGEGVQHFHGRLHLNVGNQQDFIPLFGYVGGSDLQLVTNELGYVIVRNVGKRAGFVVITGPECDPVHNQAVRAVLAPDEEREFVAPYGTGSVIYTGDEIARTRACQAEEIERMRADRACGNLNNEIGENIFEGEFDGEDAATETELLDWAAEDRFSMFYSGRLFDHAVRRYLFDLNDSEKIRFIETSRTANSSWSAIAKDGFVHIENLNVSKELIFEATGAEPSSGVIAPFGDAMLAPFREVIEIRAQGRVQTVTVKLQGQDRSIEK